MVEAYQPNLWKVCDPVYPHPVFLVEGGSHEKSTDLFKSVCTFPFFLRAQLLGIFFYFFPVSSKREGERGGERER